MKHDFAETVECSPDANGGTQALLRSRLAVRDPNATIDAPGFDMQPTAPVLTAPEREVLNRIARGQSIPAIAGELYVAASTVKTPTCNRYTRNWALVIARRPSPRRCGDTY